MVDEIMVLIVLLTAPLFKAASPVLTFYSPVYSHIANCKSRYPLYGRHRRIRELDLDRPLWSLQAELKKK